MEYKISKTCSRKISKDWQSWDFSTTLSKSVDVNSAEELLSEGQKLFEQAKALTELDIKNHLSELPEGLPYVAHIG